MHFKLQHSSEHHKLDKNDTRVDVETGGNNYDRQLRGAEMEEVVQRIFSAALSNI